MEPVSIFAQAGTWPPAEHFTSRMSAMPCHQSTHPPFSFKSVQRLKTKSFLHNPRLDFQLQRADEYKTRHDIFSGRISHRWNLKCEEFFLRFHGAGLLSNRTFQLLQVHNVHKTNTVACWCNEAKSSTSMVPINCVQECSLNPAVAFLLLSNEGKNI